MLRRVEIAYPGMHGGDGGTELTEEMIRDALRNFRGVAPLTLSHEDAQKEGVAAVGKVLSIDRPKERLEAILEIGDDWEDAFRSGAVSGWSPGFGKGANGWYLHHLALCGAVPPKQKDLRMLSTVDPAELAAFNDGADEVVNFSDMVGNREVSKMTKEEVAAMIAEALKGLKEEFLEAVKTEIAATKKEDGKKEDGNDAGKSGSDAQFADELKALKAQVYKSRKEAFFKAAEGRLKKEDIDKMAAFFDANPDVVEFTDKDGVSFMDALTAAVGAVSRPDLTDPVVGFGDKGNGEKIDFAALAQKM